MNDRKELLGFIKQNITQENAPLFQELETKVRQYEYEDLQKALLELNITNKMFILPKPEDIFDFNSNNYLRKVKSITNFCSKIVINHIEFDTSLFSHLIRDDGRLDISNIENVKFVLDGIKNSIESQNYVDVIVSQSVYINSWLILFPSTMCSFQYNAIEDVPKYFKGFINQIDTFISNNKYDILHGKINSINDINYDQIEPIVKNYYIPNKVFNYIANSMINKYQMEDVRLRQSIRSNNIKINITNILFIIGFLVLAYFNFRYSKFDKSMFFWINIALLLVFSIMNIIFSIKKRRQFIKYREIYSDDLDSEEDNRMEEYGFNYLNIFVPAFLIVIVVIFNLLFIWLQIYLIWIFLGLLGIGIIAGVIALIRVIKG